MWLQLQHTDLHLSVQDTLWVCALWIRPCRHCSHGCMNCSGLKTTKPGNVWAALCPLHCASRDSRLGRNRNLDASPWMKRHRHHERPTLVSQFSAIWAVIPTTSSFVMDTGNYLTALFDHARETRSELHFEDLGSVGPHHDPTWVA